MPRPPALPSELPAIFSVAQALAAGATPSGLCSRTLRTPFHGVRATEDAPPACDLVSRCMEYLPRLKSWQFFSHETALALLGAPMPEWPYRPGIHVSAHRPQREPRVVGVRGHRLQVRQPAALVVGRGLPVEHPVRAWRQTAALWRLDDLVAAADFLISGSEPLTATQQLAEEIEAMGDTRARVLQRALLHVRSGVRSPRETRLRLLLGRAGLPEAHTGWVLRDDGGGFVAELDLAYLRWRVGVEYDGRVHAESTEQFRKDADRWDRIRAHGWQHVRILDHHLHGSGSAAIAKVAAALRAAGWTP